MHLKILNCPDREFKPFIKDAVNYFASELITNKRIRNNCHLTIRFDAKLENYGTAFVEECNSKNQPRVFKIELHPGIGVRNIFSTLAHEMVHVKQYLNDELNEEMTLWKGKKVDSDNMDYWIHPWEIEASGIEVGLLYKYTVQNQLWNIFEEFKDPVTPIVSIPIKWKKI